ncbi:hypothetical protein G6F63_016158 [Rhizopus arrhizus]|nr:hypothetical protein G6F63_016158 [Rhizopus arrhizus]
MKAHRLTSAPPQPPPALAAAGANGASEAMAARNTPASVARATFFSGFSTTPAVTEADSTPMKAHRVSAAALEIAPKLDSPDTL